MKDNNYYGTFIEVSEDCPVTQAEIPKAKGDAKTVPVIQYEMIAGHPYRYTQEDVLFETYAIRNDIAEEQRDAARKAVFSKGQPCLRTSSLGKRYGWGIHHDAEGRMALFAIESDAYKAFAEDEGIKRVKAMRASRT